MGDFRETLYTVDSRGKRKWVYPAEISGFFKRRRAAVAAVLLVIYCSLPWIEIGNEQAVLLDIPHRRFVFFGSTFDASDTAFVLLPVVGLVLSLFFFTSLFGRVWCGWACPETVFLEFLFRPLERLIEGGTSGSRKLDQERWSVRKLRIKITKYFVFGIIAWFLASTLLAYFIGRAQLLAMMTDYPSAHWPTFLATLFLMGVLLFQFGWFREQFCTVLCPYARFQSVLLDDASLLVGYDPVRGEPRGKISARTGGDCVDCGLCVRVCPTGIDIRNGLQMECIQCALCVDACDSIMAKVGRPSGLIRYDNERGLAGAPRKIFRPRVVLYGTRLLVFSGICVFALRSRELHSVLLFHASQGALFSMQDRERVLNHLELRLGNKSPHVRHYTARITGQPEITVTLPLDPFPVQPFSAQTVPVFVSFPAGFLRSGKFSAEVEIRADDSFTKNLSIELIGPG